MDIVNARLCLLFAGYFFLSACHRDEQPVPSTATPGASAGMHSPYSLNPVPTRRYAVKLRLSGAPGPLSKVVGVAQYHAPDCWYTLERAMGVPANPEASLPVAYADDGDGSYDAVVYLDALQDGNLHGTGDCHWVFTNTYVQLQASGAAGETTFSGRILHDDIVAQRATTVYFSNRAYPRWPGIGDYRDTGANSLDDFAPTLRAETFSITFEPVAISP